LFLAILTPDPEAPRRNTDDGIRITGYAADFAAGLLDRLAARQPALAARALLAAESSLPPDQLHTAVSDILADPAQTVALQQLLRTTVPLSPRQAGLANDLAQLAALPRYPLARITAPALVVHGRFDADVPYEHATFAANALPNAALVTQPHSGHLIWLGREWPASRQRLLAFLQAHAPAPPAVPPPTTARQLRAALEATRLAYHALLAEIPPTAWERPTANPAWNVRQVLTHMLIAPENLPLDVRFIRAGRTLKPPMWLFNSLNRLYTRRRARGQTAASLAQQYDAAHARVVALLDTIGADEWALTGDYPDVNANLAAGEHTLEDMFHYLSRHFAEHAAEIRQAVAQGAQA
ncbi:MAG: DinB family protein, partial [Anaerolineales bacterium]|nr:DinB family protein [Anaerolineales bacterium]